MKIWPQVDGTRDILEEHTDTFGVVYQIFWTAQKDLNIIDQMYFRRSSIELNIIEAELTQAISIIKEGGDPTSITFRYATNAQKVKALIWAFMKCRAWEAWNFVSLIDSLTDVQIKNLTGIDQAKIDKIRQRVLKLKQIKPLIDEDDLNVES